MPTEQLLLERWRSLPPAKQKEVWEFLEFLSRPTQTAEQRVERWQNWVRSHPENSANLPNEALHRDSIYSE